LMRDKKLQASVMSPRIRMAMDILNRLFLIE
jgi:hypothetical protein